MNKLKIYDYEEFYYIGVWKLSRDKDIANFLNMPKEEYLLILKKYKALYIDYEMFFKNKRDAENCLEFLESLLIMEELTK